MVEPGQDPHKYLPKQEQVDSLINTQVHFLIGLEFESEWRDKFIDINQNMHIVDTSLGIEKNLIHIAISAEKTKQTHIYRHHLLWLRSYQETSIHPLPKLIR